MDEQRLAKKTRKESFLLESLDLIRIVIIILVLVYLIPNLVIRPETVSGISMVPTLQDGEHGVTNILASLLFGVDRFDVVAVVEPESGDQWVKRVIGLPGETVSYKDGKLYIDGVYMEENFLSDDYITSVGRTRATFTADFAAVTLGEDEYFVMGDNRVDSMDSRYRGAFKRSDIIGKHLYVLWPNMRMVTNG